MIQMQESAASSVLRFCASHRDKFRELMATGDITDQREVRSGRASWHQQERIDAETTTAIQRIRGGEPLATVAKSLGIARGTLNRRINSRGLSVRALQKSYQSK